MKQLAGNGSRLKPGSASDVQEADPRQKSDPFVEPGWGLLWLQIQRSPFLGQLYEGFVAAEILKSQVNQGGRKGLYYFRDHQGLEVDFLLPRPNARLWLIECKAGKTVRPAMAAPLLALHRTMEKRSTRLIVVYGKSRSAQATRAVARGVEAIELERFVASLTTGH